MPKRKTSESLKTIKGGSDECTTGKAFASTQ